MGFNMPKNLLKKALNEVRNSKTSTKSLVEFFADKPCLHGMGGSACISPDGSVIPVGVDPSVVTRYFSNGIKSQNGKLLVSDVAPFDYFQDIKDLGSREIRSRYNKGVYDLYESFQNTVRELNSLSRVSAKKLDDARGKYEDLVTIAISDNNVRRMLNYVINDYPDFTKKQGFNYLDKQ
jgi:hypothetical protein